MSHIFISYKREDREDKCKPLADRLRVEGFDVWFDENIEGGESWFDIINHNLEQSFIVVVIVTEAALISHYVTYEWSWALGYGLEVIPLRFYDTISSEMTGHPLLKLQGVDCRKEIPDHLLEKLKTEEIESPRIAYVRQRIRDIVMPLMILSRVSLWLSDYWLQKEITLEIISFENVSPLVRKSFDISRELTHDILPKFWLSSAHAFTGKQRKDFDKIARTIYSFEDKLNSLSTEIRNDPVKTFLNSLRHYLAEADKLRLEVEAITFSSTHGEYVALDSLLSHIANDTVQEQGFVYELWAIPLALGALQDFLPKEDATKLWEIITHIGNIKK